MLAHVWLAVKTIWPVAAAGIALVTIGYLIPEKKPRVRKVPVGRFVYRVMPEQYRHQSLNKTT